MNSGTKIYVMNMANRADRRTHMRALLHEFTNVTFVTPMPANKATRQSLIDAGHLRIDDKQPLSVNSHTATYISILASAQESEFVIMEDDLRLISPGSVVAQMSRLYMASPASAGALYYEYCHEICTRKGLTKMRAPMCAGAILWRKDAARRFASWAKAKVGAVDWWTRDAINKGVISAYGSNPPVFYQDDGFGTDLQNSDHTSFRKWQDQKKRHCLQHTASMRVAPYALSIGFVALSLYGVYRMSK